MNAVEYVKGEAEWSGLGLGEEPKFPVHELITKHRLKNVIAELPSGDEFFWDTSDTMELMLGTTEREHVNHNALCSECVQLSCSINDVYSFRAFLSDGKVVKLQIYSLERGQFDSAIYPETEDAP